MFWVPYRYSGRPKKEREERPIRGYQNGDGAKASTLINAVRMGWHHQLKDFHSGKREHPDFESMKEFVVNSLQKEHNWDMETRNYLSSIASTYINWDSRGQSEMSEEQLAQLARYALMFYDPNGKLEGMPNEQYQLL